ncbi:Ldh family oxidoreductase [Agrobacterium sp. NPDC090273]|uniref:Ldh family oxidoreductase n=1 Tax=Agrobacterium sp. NPDC090273 TaxID=3363919 RepID=UPI00383A6687
MSTNGTIPVSVLQKLGTAIFEANGLPKEDAAYITECLLYADLRGVQSHGINRVSNYTLRLKKKLINPHPSLAVDDVMPALARVDGDDGMGFLVGRKAMQEAIDRASKFGVGMALAYKSSHFGMSAIYLQQAVDAGMAAMVMTNASSAMPIWGGRSPFLGTSPFGLAAPGADVPLILDMATSVAARGKIRRASKRGEQIPEGWALDEQGKPTTDPDAALKGIVLPLGGPKGSGLSMLMEAMAGVASGAAFGGEVGNPYLDLDRPQSTGHLFMAFKPDAFLGADAYRERMNDLVGRAKSSELADGFKEILMPGEIEARLAAERAVAGLVVPPEDVAMLNAEAAAVGLEGLKEFA